MHLSPHYVFCALFRISDPPGRCDVRALFGWRAISIVALNSTSRECATGPFLGVFPFRTGKRARPHHHVQPSSLDTLLSCT